MAKSKDPGYFRSYRKVFQKIVATFTPHECMILFALQHTARGTSASPRRKIKIPGEKRRRSLLVGEGVTSYARLAQDSGLSRRSVRRFLPSLVEKLDWLETQVTPRGPKEWGGIHFRLDFRKMALWGAVKGPGVGDSQTPTTVKDSQSGTTRPPLSGSARPQLGQNRPQLGTHRPPSEQLLKDQSSLSSGPLVVRDVLSDETIDQPARVAFGELFQSWNTNGEFKAWQMLGMLLRKRFSEDPKRALAQSYYVGAYKSPRCRLQMLIGRLSRHWQVDPPAPHWDTARDAMKWAPGDKTGPLSLARILKAFESRKAGSKTPEKSGGK